MGRKKGSIWIGGGRRAMMVSISIMALCPCYVGTCEPDRCNTTGGNVVPIDIPTANKRSSGKTKSPCQHYNSMTCLPIGNMVVPGEGTFASEPAQVFALGTMAPSNLAASLENRTEDLQKPSSGLHIHVRGELLGTASWVHSDNRTGVPCSRNYMYPGLRVWPSET